MELGADNLIIFVRYPEKGKVKSRLSAALDEDAVLELYKCFVEDLLHTVKESGVPPLVAFHPASVMDNMSDWLGQEYRYVAQAGDDLGDRMKNAFLQVFAQGSSRAVLIGSDFPDLPSEIIKNAFLSLKAHDAVIGPALDGGYYLIGFSRDAFLPRIFNDVPWSTDEVFSRTMDIFRKEGCDVCRLPFWRDIDRPEDLIDLINRSRGGLFMRSKTIACLMKHVMHNQTKPKNDIITSPIQ